LASKQELLPNGVVSVSTVLKVETGMQRDIKALQEDVNDKKPS